MDEAVNMSNRNIDRLRVVRDVLDGKLTQIEAGAILKRSDRQIRRLCEKVKRQGNAGIRHGLCGRKSNNRLEDEILEQALSALHDPLWKGFGPTFALEKLDEYYGIKLGEGTVRKLMTSAGIWQVHRRGMRHRSWRPRRICVGMLTQLDGPAICAVGRRHLDYSGELPEQMEQGRSTKTGKGGKERMVSSSSALCSPAAPSPFLCLDSPPTSRPSHSLLCSLTGGMASREPTLPFTPSSRRVQATRGQEVEADVRFLLSLFFFFFCARVVHCTHSIATVALADGAGYADRPPLFISTAIALTRRVQ